MLKATAALAAAFAVGALVGTTAFVLVGAFTILKEAHDEQTPRC